jgi:hypothetical protein
MSVTAKVCRVDDEHRVVMDEGDADELELELDDDGYLSLDKSWGAVQTMIGSVTAVDLFAKEALDSSEVASLARVLKKLPWSEAVDACEAPEDEELDDVEYYFTSFRSLVLSAAKEGTGLRCTFS